MGLRELLKSRLAKSEEFKELQKQDQLHRILNERKKSANERELDRFVEEKREEEIKMGLEAFREQQKKDMMKSTILTKENMFKGHKSILHEDRSILENNNKLLHPGNMFMNKSKAKRKKGMFFK